MWLYTCMCCGLFSHMWWSDADTQQRDTQTTYTAQTHHTSIPTVVVSLMIHDNMYVYAHVLVYAYGYGYIDMCICMCVVLCCLVLCCLVRTRQMVRLAWAAPRQGNSGGVEKFLKTKNPPDELWSGRIYRSNVHNLTRVFEYLLDSNSIFRLAGSISDWISVGTVTALTCDRQPSLRKLKVYGFKKTSQKLSSTRTRRSDQLPDCFLVAFRVQSDATHWTRLGGVLKTTSPDAHTRTFFSCTCSSHSCALCMAQVQGKMSCASFTVFHI